MEQEPHPTNQETEANLPVLSESKEIEKPKSELQQFLDSIELLRRLSYESRKYKSQGLPPSQTSPEDRADTLKWIDGKIIEDMDEVEQRLWVETDYFFRTYILYDVADKETRRRIDASEERDKEALKGLYKPKPKKWWSTEMPVDRQGYAEFLKKGLRTVTIPTPIGESGRETMELASFNPETERLIQKHVSHIQNKDEEELVREGLRYTDRIGRIQQFPMHLAQEIREIELSEEKGSKTILEKFGLSTEDLARILETFGNGFTRFQPALRVLMLEKQLAKLREMKEYWQERKRKKLPLKGKLQFPWKKKEAHLAKDERPKLPE